MGGILDKLDEWLRGLLIEGITGNLSGMFDTVNTKVGEIAGEVGQTPLAWNSGVFSMIRNLSETVIVPIAGVILTFVMCYELIQLVTEKNNLHDVDTWMFFKWIFKTFCAVLIVTNTWNIVMGIFDVGQSVVNSSAGVIIGNTSIDISSVITDMEAQLEALGTCHYDEPGLEPYRTELLEIPVCIGVPGISNHGVRGNLLCFGTEYRHGRKYLRRDMGLHGLHGPAVLRPVQDRQPL